MLSRIKNKLPLTLVLLTLAQLAGAQNLNTIKTWSPLLPLQSEADVISGNRTAQEMVRRTDYIDGFGRLKQAIVKQASPAQKDVVDMHSYDSWGREVNKYLPFVSNFTQSGDVTNDGNYKATAGAQQLAYNQTLYPGENNYYYGQLTYENTPMSRVTNSSAPGNSWVGSSRSTGQQYLVNTATDNVRIWVTLDNTQGIIPTGVNTYAAGSLYKIVTVDEQGVQSIEFRDKDGRLVLKKVQLTATSDNGSGSDHAGWLCTYYTYDNYGNLRFIITPKAVALIDGSWIISSTIANELCIRYEYDQQGRVLIKKNPGSLEQWFIYDGRGRLVMAQDGNQRGQQKWQYFQYDVMDRPTSTGLIYDPSNYNNQSYHITNSASSTSYPVVGNYTSELLSQNFYDSYAWTGSTGLGSSLDASNVSNTSYFYSPSNTSFPYPQPIAQTAMLRGLMTGTRNEVLGSGGSQYLYTASFYDDKGRVVQTQSTNLTGQLDEVTTQYSWTGITLRILAQQSKGSPNAQTHTMVTKMSYDHAFRVTGIVKNISSTLGATTTGSGDRTIATYTYDEAGQVKTKVLGSSMETLTYDYNVRGWLTGINKNYTITGSSSNYFGMELGYDKTATTNTTTSFASPVYTGNLAGQVWKSKGDGIPRKYDFTYDKADRLTSGGFLQNTSSSTWDNSYINYSVNSIGYDANGNISGMNQNGFALGANSNIDNLNYNYENSGTSNRLQNVVDNANNAQSVLHDFHYAGTKSSSAVDYSYDGNGNLTGDANKNISSITYNNLNLPLTITVTGKGSITYTYNSLGAKLKKVVQENGAVVNVDGTNYTTDITTITTYIDAFVYQSKSYSNSTVAALLNRTDALLYVIHEEGRIRLVSPSGGTAYHAFDYFILDHLQNVRTILTDETQTDTYPAATLESSGISTEQKYYNIVNDASHVIPTSGLAWYSSATNSSYSNNNGLPGGSDPTINPTGSNATLYKLNGATGDRFGMGIALKVMAGDVLNVYGRSVWHSNGAGIDNSSYSINNVLTSFINAFAGTNAVFAGSKGVATGTVLNANGNTTSPLASWLTTGVPTPSGTPKAYINWIFFDEQFKPVASGNGYDPVWSSADYVKPHSVTGISVPKNGYVYIYCSNESNQDVYFDNLQVAHFRGPLMEERSYYPDGMSMAGISSRAFGKQTNFGYQNKDFQDGEFYDGTGLDEYDFEARYYDPQLARWWSQDPAGQFATPYGAMGNNWPVMRDPDGKFAWLIPIIAAVVFGTGNTIAHKDDIHNFWDGLKFFSQGAIAGAAVGTGIAFGLGVPILGTAIKVAGAAEAIMTTTSLIGGGIANGWDGVGNAAKIFLGQFNLDENRSYFGGIWRGISRFSWEMPQTVLGYSFSQLRNTFGRITDVTFIAGATAVNRDDPGAGVRWGATLGPFINTLNVDPSFLRDQIFRHEYGHTIQSTLFGPFYLPFVALPSVFTANNEVRHRSTWYETMGSRYGYNYLQKYYSGFLTANPWDFVNNPIH